MIEPSKQVDLVYDKIAEAYAEKFPNPSEYIDEFLTLLPKNTKILDLGCGVGIDSNYVASKGFKVIGIDLSKEMLDLAKHKFPKIDFRQQDIRELKFPVNSFEGILASCSLIHIPKNEISALLNKVYQILMKEGIIYISLQGGKSEEIFIDEPFKPNEKLFLSIFSFEEIEKLLRNARFSIVKKYERQPKLKNELNFKKLFIIAKKI